MKKDPKAIFLAPAAQGYASVDDRFLRTPLRVHRKEFTDDPLLTPTYGHYFEGIRDVIFRSGGKQLCAAATTQTGKQISPADIAEVRIYAEKHGSDYHPARIELFLADGNMARFVMNVAVTERGRERLYREFDVLKRLNRKDAAAGTSFLPVVYFQDETGGPRRADHSPGTDPPVMVMFLADWFQGYHEFHLSVEKGAGHPLGLVVWNPDRPTRFLSDTQAAATYAQVARILTGYYDTRSFQQIFPWHHAAGDFVVRIRPEASEVRLVTARQYAPMVEGVSVFDALLFFLLNLSLRTRLDRLDGVGDVAWAADGCVAATLSGFLEGLTLDRADVKDFISYAKETGQAGLQDRFAALVDACSTDAPDIPVIRKHLNRHIAVFHEAIQHILFSPNGDGYYG